MTTIYKPRCKYCDWRVVDNRGEKDYVCTLYGSHGTGYALCFGDESCPQFEEEKHRNIQPAGRFKEYIGEAK